MNTTLKIVAISGSLRAASLNTALLQTLKSLAPEGVEIELMKLHGIPVYDGDVDMQGKPEVVLQLVEKLRQADAFIIGTPEYNYSIPGTLKNAIDWFSRIHPQPFRAKPVGIVGASMGHLGTARAQYHLRQVFVYLDGRVMNVPEVMVGAAHTKFDSEGRLTDAATEEFLKKWLATFVAFCGR